MAGNDAQVAFWNGPVGQAWAAQETAHEALTAEVGAFLLTAVEPGTAVMEVGCGTGGLALRIADRVGPGGSVTGIDIAAPMLARARQRGAGRANLRFSEGDAQDMGGAFDLILSQFGVMFFADPVAGFAGLRRALRPGGRFSAAVWGPNDRNPWFHIPRAVAATRLGPIPDPVPGVPGPFGLSDAGMTAAALRNAGFGGVSVTPTPIHLHVPGGAAAAARWLTQTGPAASALRDRQGSEADREAIEAALRWRLAVWDGPQGLAVPAEILRLEGCA